MIVSLVLAMFAGVGAITAYSLLLRRFAQIGAWVWTAYFGLLLVSETFFTVVYSVGILYPGSIPEWVIEIFLLYAVPVSVGMSALGWLVFHLRLADDEAPG